MFSTGLSLNCNPSEKREIIEELISYSPNYSFNEIEMAHLWKSLAAWECVEYLDYKIIELFDSSPLNKEWVFNTMFQHLAELSQSEIFKTIEVSVFHAFSYSNQKGISRERGAENALTTFQIFADNAINKEGWYKRGFSERPKDAPVCLIIKFFEKNYLKIEKGLFFKVV